MPTPPNARIGLVSAYADGVATVDNIGDMPTAGGRPVIPGRTALVVSQPGGGSVCVPIGSEVTTGFARYTWQGTNAAVDPGSGGLAIDGTGSQPRTFAVNATDHDGNPRRLDVLHVGDTLTVTDDPTTPPITGFARYALTSDPVDNGTWWTFTAIRTDQSGSANPPPLGTVLRVYATLAGGGGGGSGDYVPIAGGTMTGTLNVPRLEIASEDAQTRYQLDTYGTGLGEALYLGLTTGAGLGVNALGEPLVNVPGDNVYRLLDTRDLSGSNPYVPIRALTDADDLDNLAPGLYWFQGSSGTPANAPRPYRTGLDSRWLVIQYDSAPIGNPGLGQAWQVAIHRDEYYVRDAAFLFPKIPWKRVGASPPLVSASSSSVNTITSTTPSTIPGTLLQTFSTAAAWWEVKAQAWVVAYGTANQSTRFGIAASGAGGMSSPADAQTQDVGYVKAINATSPYQSVSIVKMVQAVNAGDIAFSVAGWITGSGGTHQVNYVRLSVRQVS